MWVVLMVVTSWCRLVVVCHHSTPHVRTYAKRASGLAANRRSKHRLSVSLTLPWCYLAPFY
ncbi:hypothetical protein [Mycobacterium phage Fezzik]|nr:hypothetical protein [Mycobacterium phage Fezzik]